MLAAHDLTQNTTSLDLLIVTLELASIRVRLATGCYTESREREREITFFINVPLDAPPIIVASRGELYILFRHCHCVIVIVAAADRSDE